MEKRGNDRTRKRLKVRYGKQKVEKTGFTKNVSIGGLNIRTNNVFPPGTTLLVEITFPERSFSLWGRVRWAKQVPAAMAHVLDCGMGIAFVQPPEDWREFFERWQAGGAK